ncbi:alpha/beta hydrolase [Cupriavidus basilensis]|uniref:alpha/beta hydrolase n=1 Tax=Cupriavidus basilensis TaxID=68895 RepID=UPI00284F6F26|nr:CocE/NonD family hydrolase [Cupriavidus basilensis]MDR3384066.1 alpha/beta fold hydrolase [Cupriavidus basilensis]
MYKEMAAQRSDGRRPEAPVSGSAEPIEFALGGDRIRGTFYLPAGTSGPIPAVVLAHGWSMVAGGDLEDYAATVVGAGMAALTFDFRRLGRSDGQPRQEIDPAWQIEDFRAAISYVRSRPEVDRERIGIWGSSYSGGHALVVAAIDKRVKCVVSQVPTIDGYAAGQRRMRYDKAQVLQAAFERDREARFAGQSPVTLRMIDANPEAAVAYPGHDSYDYMGTQARRCPSWVNEVTLRSLELARTYMPGAYIQRIAPTPLLMIVAIGDGLTPADLQQEAYRQAHEPKQLMLLPGGHYSVYTEHFETTSTAAADWFRKHLA